MVKKNANFKFKGAARKIEKKPGKMKSGFIPYDDSLFKNEDNTDDIVRTYLRDSISYRSSGTGSNYYDDDYTSMW